VGRAVFLSSGGYDSHGRRTRRTFEDNLHRMVRLIEKVFPQGTRVTQPAGGFVLWVQLPGLVSARALFQQALDKGVCFAPGDVFTASGRYRNCLRLSCGQEWDCRIEDGVRTLGLLVGEAMAT
jgi:DNA-binding transcriptional MocR family regulator